MFFEIFLIVGTIKLLRKYKDKQSQIMEKLKLYNGVEMPIIGFGVYQINDHQECEDAVYNAIKVGYRMIDTAYLYGNEQAVGKAIARAINDKLVTRKDLFIVTKIWLTDFGYEKAYKSINRSLMLLGLDYVDLILLHEPFGDIYGAWKACCEAYKQGIVKAIGVSNFDECKLTEFNIIASTKPMVNQVELNPFFSQTKLVQFMKQEQIVPMAWAPLDEGRHNIFNHPVLSAIGNKYHKTAAQVALKWNIQRGVVVIPKSTHLERIKQNFDLFDFTLTNEDMQAIDELTLPRSELEDYRSNPELVKRMVSWNPDKK